MIKTILSFSLLFFVCLGAQAATITVSPGESIQDAIDVAQSGDVIELTKGVHRIEEEIRIILKNNLTIRGAEKGVIIQNLDNKSDDSLFPAESFLLRGSATITFERLFFAGFATPNAGTKNDAQIGIRSFNSARTTVKNCLFIGLGNPLEISDDPFAPFRSNMIIINNIFAYNATFGGGGVVVDILSDGSLQNNLTVIKNNLFFRNNIRVIDQENSDNGLETKNNIIVFNKPFRKNNNSFAAIGVDSSEPTTVQNNLFFKNKNNDFSLLDFTGGGALFRPFKNIATAENDLSGFSNLTLENNLSGANPKFRRKGARPSVAAFKRSWVNVSRRPKALSKFLNRLKFGLKDNSPAKNAGTDGTDIGISGGECPFTDFL